MIYLNRLRSNKISGPEDSDKTGNDEFGLPVHSAMYNNLQ